MTFPGSFDTVTITGSYVNLGGKAASGTVTFAPDNSAWLTSPATKTVIVPEVIAAQLTNGSFSVDLPAITDDPDITPVGGTYTVTENISGKSRTYSIQVRVGEGPIDLSEKAPALPVTATYTMVRSVNGVQADPTTGNIVVTPASIGAIPVPTGGAQVGQVVTATAVSGGVPTAFGLAENLLKAKTGAFVVAAAGGSTPTGSLGVAGNGASIRYTLRLPVTTSRWRFHIRNYNVRDDVTQPGQVDFTGLWVGRYGNVATGWSGAYGPTPTKVLDAWTVADLGAAEYVSPWITDPVGQLAAFTGYQLSFGYTAATGTSIARGYSGTYYTTNKADAATVAAAVTGAEVSVYDVWVEYETTTDAPLGIFCGDSIMAGRRQSGDAGLGIMSSYPPAYGVRTTSLVNNVALSGSTLSTWQDTAAFRMSRWTPFTWDYCVVGLGTNDIENGSDLATIQTAYGTTLNAIRTAWNPKRIYVCTIAPRSYTADAAAKHVIRGNLNTWLQGLPFGVQGCFRLDVPVVSSADANALDPAVATSDLVHLNTIGSQRMGGVLPGRI